MQVICTITEERHISNTPSKSSKGEESLEDSIDKMPGNFYCLQTCRSQIPLNQQNQPPPLCKHGGPPTTFRVVSDHTLLPSALKTPRYCGPNSPLCLTHVLSEDHWVDQKMAEMSICIYLRKDDARKTMDLYKR